LAANQYALVVETTPPRALIYDRNEKPIAFNALRLSAFITPSKLLDSKKLKTFLRKNFPLAAERLQKNLSSHFMFVKRHLTEREIEVIKKSGLEDVYLLKEPSRFYPIDSLSQILGITNSDNKGLFGIESIYNNVLGGKPSSYLLEKEARSGHFYFQKEVKKSGNEGKSIKLTIDSTLQFLAQDELKDVVESIGAKEGAALIIDPTNGDILVMAQYPSFNSNDRYKIDLEKTKNRVVTETYEFGSVIKVFLALAAFEEGITTPKELINCENKKETYIDGIRIGTHDAHGVITFSQVIELSNNIGTSKIAKRLGTRLYNHYIKCGFGQKTGLNWLSEQKGFVNPPNLWSKQSVFSLSFGYEVRATILQLARAFSIIANDGKLINPRIVLSIKDENGEEKTEIENIEEEKTKLGLEKTGNKTENNSSLPLYSKKTITTMRDILSKTVEQGTAKRAKIEGYEIFGKTGTANLLVNGKYSPNHNIYTFTGLIEKGQYKRIIVTFIKESNNKRAASATIAVPLFDRIARKMLIHEKVIN
jgi:cell division protein FtsI (penicillin-binding protein 3)